MASNTLAIILAAGKSSRMGEPKQLLDFHGRYLLECVIKQTLAFPFSKVLTVIGHEAENIQRNIDIKNKRFQWVFSPEYSQGQSYSLKAGLKAIEDQSNVMVFLGDQPLITSESIRTVMEEGERQSKSETPPFSLQPTCDGKPGHPVFFGNIHKIDFSTLSGDQGAKNILKTMKTRIMLPLDDPGVLMDIDTKEDYQKALMMS
jgi:molybdenum cofactor cytidylyltransferase